MTTGNTEGPKRLNKVLHLTRWKNKSSYISMEETGATFFANLLFCHFSQLVLSTNNLLLYQFLSSYQTSVVFSPFDIYSLFTLFTHPINVPVLHTTNTTPSPVLSCARSLRQYTFLTNQASLAIVPFWYGRIEAWLETFSKNIQILNTLMTNSPNLIQ